VGEITVKYDGGDSVPVEAGVYAVSVSVAEGSNFLATAEDIDLGTFSVAIAYSVTVQISDVAGYRMVSPSFTVSLIGVDTSAAYTASGQVTFGNIFRHSAFTVSAVATDYPDAYLVSASAVGSLLGDTTIVLVAEEVKPEPTSVGNNPNSNPLSAYVADNILYVSPAVERLKVVSAAGAVVLDAVAGKKTFGLAHLPVGIYVVLLNGGGKTSAIKVGIY
jgi:hypothetical protein